MSDDTHGPYLRLLMFAKDFWTRFGLSCAATCPEVIPVLVDLLNSNSNNRQENNELDNQTKRTVSKD